MDYTVTEYRDDDHEQVTTLHADLLAVGPKLSDRYLRWKYWENPFITPPPLLFVVRHGDDIVGMRGAFGTVWRFGADGDPVVVGHADDLIIDPEHRNRGLFLLLHRAIVDAAEQRGMPAIINLSGSTTTQQLSLVCGYQSLGDLDRVTRPLRSYSLSRRIGGRALRELRERGVSSDALSSRVTMAGIGRHVRAEKNPHVAVTSEPDLAGMSRLARADAGSRFHGDRGEDFLRWRFGNPQRVYRFVTWRDSELRGYLVLVGEPGMPHRVLIADHAAEDGEMFAELLAALGDRDDVEYQMMSSTLSAGDLQRARQAAFVPDGADPGTPRTQFLWLPVAGSGGVPPVGDLQRPGLDGWRVTLLDSMAA